MVYDPVSDTFVEGRIVIDAAKANKGRRGIAEFVEGSGNAYPALRFWLDHGRGMVDASDPYIRDYLAGKSKAERAFLTGIGNAGVAADELVEAFLDQDKTADEQANAAHYDGTMRPEDVLDQLLKERQDYLAWKESGGLAADQREMEDAYSRFRAEGHTDEEWKDYIEGTGGDAAQFSIGDEPGVTVGELQDRADHAWHMAHNAEYSEVYNRLHGTKGWLKAPNGQPTRLTPVQYVLVRTPAFKAWFGDWENDPANASKVVDENGEPLVVYHGGNIIDNKVKDYYGDGIRLFATDSRKVAQEYVDERNQSFDDDVERKVYHAFVNFKNPLIVDAKGSLWKNINGKFAADYANEAVKLGNDGVIIKDVMDSAVENQTVATDYIVLSKGQIKSATDNTGAFNAGNPDIRFSIAPVYTGSAADYERPSLVHVGTGEGSQVYGWGLYGSSVKGVADTYAMSGKVRDLDSFEKAFRQMNADGEFTDEDVFGAAQDVFEANEDIEAAMKSDDPRTRDFINSHRKEIEAFVSAPQSSVVYSQTFFTNREPGDESHLLSWYEPVSEENLKRIADEIAKTGRKVVDDGVLLNKAGTAVGPMKQGMTGQDVYRVLTKAFNSEKAASEFLARADIDGIKYPVDSYGGKGVKDGDKAGWNYVSFRDDNIRIDHKWVDGKARFSLSSAFDDALPSADIVREGRRYGFKSVYNGASANAVLAAEDGRMPLQVLYAMFGAKGEQKSFVDMLFSHPDIPPEWHHLGKEANEVYFQNRDEYEFPITDVTVFAAAQYKRGATQEQIGKALGIERAASKRLGEIYKRIRRDNTHPTGEFSTYRERVKVASVAEEYLAIKDEMSQKYLKVPKEEWDALKAKRKDLAQRMYEYKEVKEQLVDAPTADEMLKLLENDAEAQQVLSEAKKGILDAFGRKREVPVSLDAEAAAAKLEQLVQDRHAHSYRFSIVGTAAIHDSDRDEAERMEKDGRTRESIFDKTGLWRGSDGNWRREIPDITEKTVRTLRDLYDAPETYVNKSGAKVVSLDQIAVRGNDGELSRLLMYYPDLARLSVIMYGGKKTKRGYDGVTLINPSDNYKGNGQKEGQAVAICIALKHPDNHVRHVLVHELQHVIQGEEGWENGTTSTRAGSFETYAKSAGEIEARVAATRALSENELPTGEKFYPWETEEAIRKYLAYKYGSGTNGITPVQVDANIDEMLSKFDEAKGKTKEQIIKEYNNEQKVIAVLPGNPNLPDQLKVKNPVVRGAQSYILNHLLNQKGHEFKYTANDAKRVIKLINPNSEIRIVPQRSSLSLAFIGANPKSGWDCIVIAPHSGEFYIFKTMFGQNRKPYQDKTKVRYSLVSVRRGEAADRLIRGGLSSIRDFSETARSIPQTGGGAQGRNVFSIGTDADEVAALLMARNMMETGLTPTAKGADAVRRSLRANASAQELVGRAVQIAEEQRKVLNYVASDPVLDRIIARAGKAARHARVVERTRKADIAWAHGVERREKAIRRAEERELRGIGGVDGEAMLNFYGIDPAALLMSFAPPPRAEAQRKDGGEAAEAADVPHALTPEAWTAAKARADEAVARAKELAAKAREEAEKNPVAEKRRTEKKGAAAGEEAGADGDAADEAVGSMMTQAVRKAIAESGITLDDAAGMVKFAEAFTEQYLKDNPSHFEGLDFDNLWDDPRVRAFLSGNIASLAQMAAEAYAPSYARERVAAKAQMLDDRAVTTLGAIERIGVEIFEDLNRDLVRQSRRELIREIHRTIDRLAKGHRDNQLAHERKVEGEVSEWLKFVRRAIDMSAGEVERRSRELTDFLNRSYASADDAEDSRFRDYHLANLELAVLDFYGNLRGRMPAEIKAARDHKAACRFCRFAMRSRVMPRRAA